MIVRPLGARIAPVVQASKWLQHARRRYDRRFDIVFVTGVSSSGTTLLLSLLDQYYQNCLAVRSKFVMPPPLDRGRDDSFGTLAAYRRSTSIPDFVTNRSLRRTYLDFYRHNASYPKISPVVLDHAPVLHMARAQRLKEIFPSARFLVICRDPVVTIDGLRRKWDIYSEASLLDVCDFWEGLHRSFLLDSRRFANDVLWVCYERLVSSPQEVSAMISSQLGLSPRPEPKPFMDRPDRPKKGLRNVRDGRIEVFGEKRRCELNLERDQQSVVDERLGALYRDLRARADRGLQTPEATH